MSNKNSKNFGLLGIALAIGALGLFTSGAFAQFNIDDQGFQRSTTTNPGATEPPKPTHVPGLGWGGIPFDENAFREVPSEKCNTSGIAEVVGEYDLTQKVYLLKGEKGFIVATIEQTLKEIETGQRRKKLCPVPTGLKLDGEVECKGIRVIKETPFNGCAYEMRIFGHSLNEKQAIDLLFKKLKQQHVEYKKECVLPPKPKTIKEDLNSLF